MVCALLQRRGGAVGSGDSAREPGRAAGTNLLIMPSLFSCPLGQEEAGLSWSRLDCEVTVIVVTVVVAVKPNK